MLGAVPELPEVETIRRQLAPRVEGRRIERARDPRPALVRAARARRGLPTRVDGPRVERLGRRGKYLVLRARGRGVPDHAPADDRRRCSRPGADAPLRARAVRARATATSCASATRAASAPASSRSATAALDEFFAARVGVEPLGDELHGRRLRALARGRPRADQGVPARPAAGRGRREHLRRRGAVPRADPPAAPGRRADRGADEALAGAVRDALTAGLAAGGATIDDFRHPDGVAGRFQDEFLVHLREGEACARCGGEIVKFVAAGRGTYVCERCQPRPPRRTSRFRTRTARRPRPRAGGRGTRAGSRR